MKKLIIALSLGMLIGSATTAIAATSETVQATIAKFVIKVNGQEKQLATSPIVVDGNSYLPVREVAGLLGAEVGYDDATRTISLQTPVPVDKLEEKTGAGANMTETGYRVGIRAVMDFLVKKHSLSIKDSPNVGVDEESPQQKVILWFNGNKYHLDYFETDPSGDTLVDVGPLLESKVLTIEDLKNVQ
ncbi:Copper amine oxidase N-terminal domain-containing protein [Paenibacillus sp. UNCCL117]|uniref:copper amine oxidase N-terminal domain-containing protein n=1 Tax=unclassified Paenibacillus TaxID=185978 RepID=UPI00088C6008|nr:MULTISPECIES: copper amine oxidase N-terminal domain-containing protein [unclassified Paenibacillus]SDC70315.1 Copper amine oxidase N-terminal domain-containing protein [Paenibacillus sp. cl123]SFW24161.1 Copper amine oxidase N-terminal domain-containing protein [Paenibacillus sp. UNCCL117]